MVDDSRDAPTPDGYATTQPPADDGPATRESISTMQLPPIVDLPDAGYELGDLIGRGGMGEVIEARDRRIGRDVALKRMRSAHPTAEATTRFLREARIQGRLDHPAIVPVHELGIDAEGRPFFTMKRIVGRTLAERLTAGEPIQPLLRAFVDVCLAIELAHERGVVHRDLKPSNIMMGDYGEVYVLDWGVARVLAEEERRDGGGDIDTLDETTRTGAILGTPGYMSPEQVRAEPIEFSADIYALGAILFEILAGEPLHPHGTAGIASTLATPQQAPAARRPERAIAPELDRVCFDALAEVAMQRPRARTIADRVQRYIDGDRDLERRRELANELLVDANAALRSVEGQATGLRLAGRALALDPESDAAALVAKLVTEPPTVLPAECQAVLEDEAAAAARGRTRIAASITWAVLAAMLLLPLVSVRSWPWLVAFCVTHLVIGSVLYAGPRWLPRSYIWIAMAMTLATPIIWSRIAGVFILVPVLLCGALLGLTSNPNVMKRAWLFLLWAMTAVMCPLVLEWIGVLDRTTTVVDNHIAVRSIVYDVRGSFELGALTAANLGTVMLVALYGLGVNRLVTRTQRKLSIQNWQLHQLRRT